MTLPRRAGQSPGVEQLDDALTRPRGVKKAKSALTTNNPKRKNIGRFARTDKALELK